MPPCYQIVVQKLHSFGCKYLDFNIVYGLKTLEFICIVMVQSLGDILDMTKSLVIRPLINHTA